MKRQKVEFKKSQGNGSVDGHTNIGNLQTLYFSRKQCFFISITMKRTVNIYVGANLDQVLEV